MPYSSILHAIKAHAEETPDKLCMGDKQRQATYAEFWAMIQRAAVYLKSIGVEHESVIAIHGCQRVEYFLALFGIQLAGGTTCPIEKSTKEDRILEVMSLVNAKIYIGDKPIKCPSVISIPYTDFLRSIWGSQELSDEPTLPEGESLAEILFTTGTTGTSKGIEITHANNIALAQNVSSSVGEGPDEVELITAPVTHSMALRRTYSELYRGGTVVLTDGAKFLNSFFDLMDQYGVTAISFVPAIAEQILRFERDRFSEYDAKLNYIQFGSAALSGESKSTLVGMFPHVRMYNIYGSTESGCVTSLEFSGAAKKNGCIGTPTVNAEVLFVDENHVPVQATAETPGFLAFSGGMNMRGYYKEPELTAEVLDEKGIVYTSDLGYRGEDGLIYLLGRKGDVINVGGIKVAPTEIEEVAMKHPMVKDCACIPVADIITGEATKLFLSLNEGYLFDQKELTRFLLGKLEALKVPKVYEVVDEIPRTFNGKIKRKQLQERQYL